MTVNKYILLPLLLQEIPNEPIRDTIAIGHSLPPLSVHLSFITVNPPSTL